MISRVRYASVSTALCLSAAAFAQDVTRPGDLITGSSFNYPAGEAPALVIDNTASTKYLNFDRLFTGFTVSPSGTGIVRGISLVTANDAPERDPTSFILEGSNDGVSFFTIAEGPLSPGLARFSLSGVAFENSTSYSSYRVTFPTVRANSNSMQVAEVQLVTALDVTSPADALSIILPEGGFTGANEDVTKLVDDRLGTKLDVQLAGRGNTVVNVTPAVGPTVLTGITIYGANDDTGFPGRTPQTLNLEGSNDGVNYTTLLTTALVENTLNYQDQSFSFPNSASFTRYRLTFGPPFGGGDLQLGEISLLGTVGSTTNDDCSNPTPVTVGINGGSNLNATAGSQSTSCDDGPARDVWYTFTSPTSGPISVSTCGSVLDTVLAVYNSCGSAAIACANNTCGAGSIVQFNAVQGATYLIRVAGTNGTTGSFSLVIDDAVVPHTDYTIALPYNFNGMVQAGEGGDPDIIDGYRSISDRGLRLNGLPGSIEVGLLGTTGIPYEVETRAGVLDIVHIGDRNGVDNGNWAFDLEAADGDNIGVQPSWLTDTAQNGPHTASMTAAGVRRMGDATQIGLLYHVSNGGGLFDVTLNFTDGTSATVTVEGPDWFGDQNVPLPLPGVASQRQLGIYTGADAVDFGGNGVPLNVIEAVISTQSLNDAGLGNVSGRRLASIAFGNRSSFTAGYAIFAASIRDPGCPADMDGSGGVDSDDVIVFFGLWDVGNVAADFTGEGGVDSDDVIEFFGRWDSGC